MVTIDEAIALLQQAKKKIGGDKVLILSLTASGIEDAEVTKLHICAYGENEGRYIEVQVNHPSLSRG